MKYKEYCNQGENPQRHPRVEITLDDIFWSWKVPYGENVDLHWISGNKAEHFVYFVPTGSNRFWTMDEDGNKSQRSVFVWSDEVMEQRRTRNN